VQKQNGIFFLFTIGYEKLRGKKGPKNRKKKFHACKSATVGIDLTRKLNVFSVCSSLIKTSIQQQIPTKDKICSFFSFYYFQF
jgi:hypothetical protein